MEVKEDSFTHVAGDIGLVAIAQCTTTLELSPASADATSILKESLPLYNGSLDLNEHKIGSENRHESAERWTKQDVLDRIPISRQEFEEAWSDLCAFEFSGRAWVPSAADRSGIWKSIMSAAALENADLVKGFSPGILQNIVIRQDAYPDDLLDAVLRRLCNNHSNILDSSISSCPFCKANSLIRESTCIKPRKMC